MGNAELRDEVCRVNRALLSTGLVTMHSGNASGLDRQSGVLVIKPSGMDYDCVTPECLVAVSLETGEVLEGGARPSVDLPHHLYLYRNMPEIQGVVHTHSNYATAFAAVRKNIPLALTSIADEFGGEIPCAPYVDNEGEAIGRAILEYRGRGPAILLGNHGVFTWGPTPTAALKAAVMVEDAAKTLAIAHHLGTIIPLPPDEAEKWYDRYQNRYGQY